MKRLQKSHGVGVALATLALAGLASSAQAVPFESLPATPTGFQYEFKLRDFDNGTLYGVGNGSYGFGAGGGAGSVATGVAALDALGGIQAAGAHAIGAFGNNLEDSWGIANITDISRVALDPLPPSTTLLWRSFADALNVGDNQQLTMFFYGEQDFYLNEAGAIQTTGGVGLHVDIYLQNVTDPGFTTFDPSTFTGRPVDTAGFSKANDASFPSVTDSNGLTFTLGAPVLQLVSTSGFLHPDGSFGGLATEFETIFQGDATAGTGLGTAFFDVVGGSLAGNYNTNSIVSPYANTAGTTLLAGQTAKTADISVQFTSTTSGSGDWLVSSQDPLRAAPIPEPTSALAGLACLLPVLGSVMSRRRRLVA